MEQAGRDTRPGLLIWCGAPRRNRTGDPILTMEPPGTAVRAAVSPGHARPSGSKLSVLLRQSYALSSSFILVASSKPPRGSSAGQQLTPVAQWRTNCCAGCQQARATTLSSWSQRRCPGWEHSATLKPTKASSTRSRPGFPQMVRTTPSRREGRRAPPFILTVEGTRSSGSRQPSHEPGGSGSQRTTSNGARHKLAVALRLLPDPQPSSGDDLGLRVAGRQRTGSGRRGTGLIRELAKFWIVCRIWWEPGMVHRASRFHLDPSGGTGGTGSTVVSSPPC